MGTMSQQLLEFVARELLEGEDVGLTDTTPLLELGVIDSMSIVLIQRFVQSTFGVDIPPAKLTPQNLASVSAICQLVDGLKAAS